MQVEQVRLVGGCHCARARLVSLCVKHASMSLYSTAPGWKLQVRDDEFFAVEQALLAAGRQLAVRPEDHAASATKIKTLPSFVTQIKKLCTAVPDAVVVDSRKRKLPPSLAQQHKQTASAAPVKLQYKVPDLSSQQCMPFHVCKCCWFIFAATFASSQRCLQTQSA